MGSGQKSSGVGVRAGGNLFGGPRGDQHTAAGTTLRTEVEHMIGAADDVEVVFNDDDGVSLIDDSVEGLDEEPDIVEVEARSGFVQDEQ